MAGHNEESGGMHHDTGQTSITLSLSFVAGIGLLLVMGALLIGVIDGGQEMLVWLMFILGMGMFIAGAVGWFGVVQPHKNFDDINVPMYHGHDHHDDDAHSDEHALTVHEEATPTAHH